MTIGSGQVRRTGHHSVDHEECIGRDCRGAARWHHLRWRRSERSTHTPSVRKLIQRYIYLGCRIGFPRSRRTLCCALIAVATLRMRCVAMTWSDSLWGTCEAGADGRVLSLRSCLRSWTFSISHRSRHRGQLPIRQTRLLAARFRAPVYCLAGRSQPSRAVAAMKRKGS